MTRQRHQVTMKLSVPSLWQECETKIAQEIASLSKEDVSKEEMNENEEVINILLAQVDGRRSPAVSAAPGC